MPQLSGEQGKLLTRMANMEKQKRMVQLLEPAFLIEGEELKSLSAVM
jgi:purine-binding chemotaxis protein CheW